MDDLRAGRGDAWDHDPGPPRNRRWARLFADIPDYRGLGLALGGDVERFRWQFGPVFYRGRLGDRQVKVLVVGQDAGSDEALAHRSFVGESGSRVQHLLAHLGITRSYLFLNTFVYSITGQFGGALAEPRARSRLARGPAPQPAVRLRGRAQRPTTRGRGRAAPPASRCWRGTGPAAAPATPPAVDLHRARRHGHRGRTCAAST